jgi:hypothetical protein
MISRVDDKMLGHLRYEMDCFTTCVDMILSRRINQRPLGNFTLEILLLHYRSLWDFFNYPPKKKWKTDVDAGDFVPAGTLSSVGAGPKLKEIRESCDVALAHLSTDRLDPGFHAGKVRFEEIRLMSAYIEKLAAAFYSALTQGQREAMVNPLGAHFSPYAKPPEKWGR